MSESDHFCSFCGSAGTLVSDREAFICGQCLAQAIFILYTQRLDPKQGISLDSFTLAEFFHRHFDGRTFDALTVGDVVRVLLCLPQRASRPMAAIRQERDETG